MKKCAIVTGATKGIGLGIALGLASEGYNLVLSHVSPLNDEQKTEFIEKFKSYDVSVDLIQANVASFEACEILVNIALEKYDNISVLVNNAGITKDNLLMKMSESDFSEVINTNLVGCFSMSKLVSKKMMRAKYGRIINITSVIGEIGNAGQSNYAASKAGVIGFSKSLAKELASRNITVNCIAPGFIKTSMTAKLDEKISTDILSNIPLKRFGEVEDVVNAVLFLANEKTSYITGQTINVCGGMVM